MEQTLPKILRRNAEQYPDVPAQYSRSADGEFQPVTYAEYYRNALDFGAGLLSAGIVRGEHIGLISDNRQEWTQADMGLMSIGAADVPRGCDATERDLRYILSFADCRVVIAENGAQVQKILSIKNDLPLLDTFITFDPVGQTVLDQAASLSVQIRTFGSILEVGRAFRDANPGHVEAELEKGTIDDIACIIFTSGTTGEPKGVMLSHGNFITQLDELPERINLDVGDRALCVLPVWHSFQRLCEYVILVQTAAICYSKPIGSVLLADFQKLNPQLMPAVPRVFEAIYEGVFRAMRKTGGISFVLFRFFLAVGILHSRIDRRLLRKQARFGNDWIQFQWIVLVLPWILLYPVKLLGDVLVFRKIRAKLGTAFRGGVSGGGALPRQIDDFFWAVGVNIVEGYGLTETAPVVSVRPFSCPIFGTVGKPIRGVRVRIVGEDGTDLGCCAKGVVQVKGGTVMKGYYKRPDLTARAINSDGWFDTGDIGLLTVDGELVLRGRKKDTIVLRGGENVEPLPIEMRLNESRYIAQSVVLGQDERYLAALIVVSEEDVKSYAEENFIDYKSFEVLLAHSEIQKLFDTEIKQLVSSKTGFKLFERISRFVLLAKPFQVGIELSAKQEIMRYRIPDLYAKEVKSLFK
jgi:long-chain acyl-CoA synthetase